MQRQPERRCPRQCACLQSEVGEDPLDHRRIENVSSDLELEAAEWAVRQVDREWD